MRRLAWARVAMGVAAGVGLLALIAHDHAIARAGSSATLNLTIPVSPPADHLALNAPSSTTASVSFSVQVTALDHLNRTAVSYVHTVHFTSTDATALLPADHMFTRGSGGDNGQRTFTVTLNTAGAQSVIATDTSDSSIHGSAMVAVTPAIPAMLTFTTQPADTDAGASFAVAVGVFDQFGNLEVPDGGRSVSIALTGGPSGAALLGTLTQVDSGGVATFNGLSIQKAGTGYGLTAASSGIASADSASFSVRPAALFTLVVRPATAAITFGASQGYSAEAFDRYGNSRGDASGTTVFALTLDGSCALALCTPGHAGPHQVTGISAGVTSAPVSLAVGPASTGLGVTATTAQYSDPTTLIATVTPWKVLGSTASGSVAFSIAGSSVGAVSVVPSDGGTAATAVLSPIITLAPGTYAVRASFTTMSADFLGSVATGSLVVLPEDAGVVFTGPNLIGTGCVGCATATVALSSTVKDITAVPADPSYDPYPGDVRTSTVRFVNRDTGATLCTATVGLINPADLKVGTVICNWSASIGTSASKTLHVGTIVGGFYVRNLSADDQTVTIVRTTQSGSAAGAGTLKLIHPSGSCPGRLRSTTAFAFGARIGSAGTTPGGAAAITVSSAGSCTAGASGQRTYLVTSLAVSSLTISQRRATLIMAATIRDVTNQSAPTLVDSGAIFKLDMVEGIEPGGSDSLAITVWGSGGGLWFASDWNGSAPVQDVPAVGDIFVRQPVVDNPGS